jgi:hypothetical protein
MPPGPTRSSANEGCEGSRDSVGQARVDINHYEKSLEQIHPDGYYARKRVPHPEGFDPASVVLIRPDGFPLPPGNLYAAEHALLSDYITGIGPLDWEKKPRDYAAGRTILGGNAARQIRMVHALLERMYWHQDRPWGWGFQNALEPLLGQFLRRKLPYTRDDIRSILEGVVTHLERTRSRESPVTRTAFFKKIWRNVERHLSEQGLDSEIWFWLERFSRPSLLHGLYAEERRLRDEIQAAIGKR